MRITIPRSELKDAVAGMNRIVGLRSSLQILTCIRLDAGKAGITATATDLDQTAIYRFQNAQAEGRGACIVPFQVLKDLAKGAESENVEIVAVDDEHVTVTNHVGVHALTQNVDAIPPKEWPPMDEAIETSPADQFLPTYRRLAPFASVDATRRVLNGVYVDMSGKGENNVTLVATDGRRLTCCNSLKLPFNVKNGVIVPVTKFLTWAALGDECKVGIYKDKQAMLFALETGPWTYRTKTVDGYPNWRQVMCRKEDLVQQFAFTDTDVEALKKLLPAFPGGEGIAIVGNAEGAILLAGRKKDDKQETTVQLTGGSRYTGAGCRICVNRQYLLEAFGAGFRNFGFADGHSPLRADDEQGAVHVLMPLRTEGLSKVSKTEPTPEPAQAPAETVQPTPAAETQPETPKETPKETTMPPENTPETTALEKLQAAYEVAKAKVREASQALADVADAIKLAAKEDRQRRNEVDTVRAGLQKLQAIKV